MTRDQELVKIMRELNIVDPVGVLADSRAVGFELAACCAMLRMETYGGRNIFGADPTTSIPSRWKDQPVTHARYIYYKARRRSQGAQGVGPCQLTSPDLQDAADKIGGCWHSSPNRRIGFEFLKSLLSQYRSLQSAFSHYNGAGPAAERYGARAVALRDEFHSHFSQVS